MLILAPLLAASFLVAQDPIRVTSSLTAEHVEVGTPTTLRITVETRGEAPNSIHLPALPRHLDIIATSDYSQTQISMPGGRSRATRREIVIVARRPGVYRIPSASVDVGGRTHRTRPLDLVVTAGPSAGAPSGPPLPAPGDDPPDERAPARSSLRMWALPDTVFVGEQILLHAEATFGEDARTRQSRPATFDPPAPSGFWIQDVPNPVSVSLRIAEGRTVETQTFRRAYFPLDAGSYTIPPARLYYEARRGFLAAPETRQLESDSLRVVVRPLPLQDRPSGFNGAVGRLRMRAAVEPDRIVLGEAAFVTVDLEGVGNVKGLPEPRLPDLPHADVFTPTQESRVEVVDLRVGGTKRFRWLVVPQQPGRLTIPPIEYSFFDPELRQYVTLHTDTLHISASAIAGTEVEDTVLRPLRGFAGREPAGWALTPAFAVLQLVPLLTLALAVSIRRRRAAPPGPRQHYRRIRRELAALRERTAGGRLAELEHILIDAAVTLGAADSSDPVETLRRAGRAGAASALGGLLREISRRRFSPDGADRLDGDLLARARAFVRMLAPKGRWSRRGATTAAALVAFGGCAMYVHGSADAFELGVTQYRNGDFVAAAAAFHDYARSSPRDPHGWYNLGLAAHAAGDRGRAAWAWLRASRYAPRDPDLRHNLDRLRATEALRQTRAPDLLAPGERAVLAATGWWLLILAIGLRRRLRRTGGWSVTIAALLIVAAAAAAGFESSRPVSVTPLGSGAPLFAGPSIHDDGVGRLEVGSLVRLVENRGDWLRVRLDGRREAWVERRAVAAP